MTSTPQPIAPPCPRLHTIISRPAFSSIQDLDESATGATFNVELPVGPTMLKTWLKYPGPERNPFHPEIPRRRGRETTVLPAGDVQSSRSHERAYDLPKDQPNSSRIMVY